MAFDAYPAARIRTPLAVLGSSMPPAIGRTARRLDVVVAPPSRARE